MLSVICSLFVVVSLPQPSSRDVVYVPQQSKQHSICYLLFVPCSLLFHYLSPSSRDVVYVPQQSKQHSMLSVNCSLLCHYLSLVVEMLFMYLSKVNNVLYVICSLLLHYLSQVVEMLFMYLSKVNSTLYALFVFRCCFITSAQQQRCCLCTLAK